MPEPRTFTVMCHDRNGVMPIWIDTVTLPPNEDGIYPLEAVKRAAVEKCAYAWDHHPEDRAIICMGVALGPVNFLYFDDSHLGD